MVAVTTAALIQHRVECFDPTAHLFRVTLAIQTPASQQRIALPVWIPGSYLVREFAKQLQSMAAIQGGKKIALQQLDKSTWQLDCQANAPVEVSYLVYAFDASVRTAYLDSLRGFFNGTSLFMRVAGQEASAQQVLIEPPTGNAAWQAATALPPIKVNKSGWGSYLAENYDELADSPFELGDFWQGAFTVRGIQHRFVVSGAAPTFDGERLLRDTQTIVEAELNFWHGDTSKPSSKPISQPPQSLIDKGYVFMLYATADGYGGLEHKNSTALIAKRSDLPRLGESTPPEGYTTLLGLISHEYFHTWNVKRLRPSELATYDYTRENHTQMLWFFEGFTSYYDDLLLCRAGLISQQQYLDLLAKTINQVLQTPGRLVHSLASSSFEAWTKYYRPDENSVNSTVSYYTKGALVALCLDLSLRASPEAASNKPSQIPSSLDHVMRALWARTHQNGNNGISNNGVMTEQDVLEVLQNLSGRSFAAEIKVWVHGTKDLPLSALLATAGVETTLEKAPFVQQLGLKVDASNGIKIKSVQSGSLAAKAGFSAGDEWLAVETVGKTQSTTWRITSMEDLALYALAGKPLLAWVVREKLIVKLKLVMPKDELRNGNVKLLVQNSGLAQGWLRGHSN